MSLHTFLPLNKTSSSKSRNAAQSKSHVKKEKIAEKVKEIQLRQKNWLRQRDEHISTISDTSLPPETKQSAPKLLASERSVQRSTANGRSNHNADILKVHHDDSNHHFTAKVSDKLNVKVKHGFGAWLKSRKDEGDTNHSRVCPEEEHNHGTVGTEHLQQERSGLSASSGISSGYSSRINAPLSPEQFDSLADTIAARVKQDLGIHHNSSSNHSNPTHSGIVNRQDYGRNANSVRQLDKGEPLVEDDMSRGKTFVQNHSAGQGFSHNKGDGDVDVSSHCCPFCSVLMATSEHVPTLIVPCGHTVCKRCATSHSSCRLCGTNVASLTTNIMLQQIIQEYHRKNHHETNSHQVMKASYQRVVSADEAPTRTAAKNNDAIYAKQLQNLMDRQETMQEEAASRKREYTSITSKVQRSEKQLGAIEREEKGLLAEIQRLEEKLQGLCQHKEEYALEYQQLKAEHKVAESKVELVEATLRSLGEEIDKVRFLAEGQRDMHAHRRNHRQ